MYEYNTRNFVLSMFMLYKYTVDTFVTVCSWLQKNCKTIRTENLICPYSCSFFSQRFFLLFNCWHVRPLTFLRRNFSDFKQWRKPWFWSHKKSCSWLICSGFIENVCLLEFYNKLSFKIKHLPATFVCKNRVNRFSVSGECE